MANHFEMVPTTELNRSTFEMQQNIRQTFNVGELVPFFVYPEVYPGETYKVKFTFVCRASNPKEATMDNAYADVYFFYDPDRNNWEHAKAFYGEATNAAWVNPTEYVIPHLLMPNTGTVKGTVLQHLKMARIGVKTKSVSALPVRMYTHIYNEWFRDQNLIAPATHYTDDTDRTHDPTVTELGGPCYKVARFHDYFSSALPNMQRGQAQLLSLGVSAPVIGNGKALGLIYQESASPYNTKHGGLFSGDNGTWGKLAVAESFSGAGIGPSQTPSGAKANDNTGVGVDTDYTKSNLLVDFTHAVGGTISALRQDVQMQRLLEAMARGGARYREIARNIFKTTMPDQRALIPEFLGAKRVPLEMTQVASTNAANNQLGKIGAYSLTVDSDDFFTKSFTEWGCIMGLICVRTDRSYSQGINRMFTRRRRYDKFWPQFQNLSEQPIYNYEIYSDGSSTDDEVFGYQERYAELRYLPNINAGEFDPDYSTALTQWHYGDDYGSLPVLSQSWIEEPVTNFDRTIHVTSAVSDQIIMDSRIELSATKGLGLWSIPGLLDHF